MAGTKGRIALQGGTASSRDQQRWDQYGADRLAALRTDPGRFVVTTPPYAHMPFVKGLVAAIGPVAGHEGSNWAAAMAS